MNNHPYNAILIRSQQAALAANERHNIKKVPFQSFQKHISNHLEEQKIGAAKHTLILGEPPRDYNGSIHFHITESNIGKVFIGIINDALGILELVDPEIDSLHLIKQTFPKALFIENHHPLVNSIIAHLAGDDSPVFPLYLAGTSFQHKVWQTLLRIPRGTIVSYNTIATAIGAPLASRAVGTAIGKNNIAILVPCHRVVTATGQIGGYKWSPIRKHALLTYELGL